MSEKILEEDQTEIEDLMTTDELLMNLAQDLILNNDPEDIASDFIDEFVLRNREETPQIFMMLEMPSENLVEMLKDFVIQGNQLQLEALDNTGFQYFENLKVAVKRQMTELAEQ